MNEPAADLAIACAIASSYYEKALKQDTAVIGEIGLGGELRPVVQLERRIIEAQKLGFKYIVVPEASEDIRSEKIDSIQVVRCPTVEAAFDSVLGSPSRRRVHKRNEQEDDIYYDGDDA